MPEVKELKAGDKCPNCGGTLALDTRHGADAAIDRYRRRQPDARLVSDYADGARAKIAEHGELYTCSSCGYQARLKTGAGARPSSGTSGGGGRQAPTVQTANQGDDAGQGAQS